MKNKVLLFAALFMIIGSFSINFAERSEAAGSDISNGYGAQIAGNRSVGSILSADITGWESTSSFTYQWLRDGSIIAGASSASYLVSESDWLRLISVTVTASANGQTALKTSSAVLINQYAEFATPTVSISGTNMLGNELVAGVNGGVSGALLTYQWLRNGSAISTATNAAYSLGPNDAGTNISVQVRIAKTGYLTSGATSGSVYIYAGAFLLTPTPTVLYSTPVAIGSVLSGDPGSWDSGAQLSYKWICNFSTKSTSLTLQITQDLFGLSCYFSVTASKTAFKSVTKDSSQIAINGLATIVATQSPNISGELAVGKQLSARASGWDAGVVFTFTWFVDGVYQGRGTTFNIDFTHLGKRISVSAEGSKLGFASVTRTSPDSTQVVEGKFDNPRFSWAANTIQKKSWIDVSKFSPSASFSVQWLRDGVPIPGATDLTYFWTDWDQGRILSAKFTASKRGFVSITADYYPMLIPGDKILILSHTTGGKWEVGGTVTAVILELEPGANVKYQWLRDGEVIPGANSESYNVIAADSQRYISLSVTASKTGMASVTKKGAGVQISGAATPGGQIPGGESALPSLQITVTGNATVGNVLVSTVNSRSISLPLRYQWFRDGNEIANETSITYKLTTSDLGHQVFVKVSGFDMKSSFISASSSPVSVTQRIENKLNPTAPTIKGLANVGKTLSAQVKSWGDGVTYRFVWLRDGKPIAGASSSSYKINKSDRNRNVSARVVGTYSDGFSRTMTSKAVQVR